ncbi:MAG: iron-containing alcohol dehydrogenase, partial [Treponema sp.]|nr:iron-containing alcohol dehydrogenase [Treponema sp.]
MILSLESPVQVHEFDRIEAGELLKIVFDCAGSDKKSLKIAVVLDKTPLAERDRILKILAGHCTVTRFDRVEPNPGTADIMSMFGDLTLAGADLVLGIGGGSVMDSAKALAMLAVNGGSLDGYLGSNPSRTIKEASLPLLLVPTTAGTGSEVTKVGVYTSREGRKYTLGSPLMLAKGAILSGSLLGDIPPGLCASTGLDALDHSLESIWNKNATPRTREMAEAAAVEVLTWLPPAYANALQKQSGADEINRNMLRASCMAGAAFSITGTAAGHALSFVLSEDWHIPHGAACAFTLPDIYDLAAAEKETAASLGRICEKLYAPGKPVP